MIWRHLAVVLLGCVSALALPAQDRAVDLAAFDHVWQAIRDRHFDPELGGLDWDAAREEFRPKVETAESRREVRALIQQMLDQLDQTHLQVVPRELLDDLALPDQANPLHGETGIDLRVVDGRALVTEVRPGSPAAGAGVQMGWEITRVGEDEVAESLERISQQYAGSTLRHLALAGAVRGRLRGIIGETVAVEFRDGRDEPVALEIALAKEPGEESSIGFIEGLRVLFESRRMTGTVGYIRFNQFLNPVYLMPRFEQAIESFRDTEGIVIDVRGNQGGMLPIGMGLAGWLISEEGQHLGTLRTRDTRLRAVVFPRAAAYTGRVAVLVDGLSASCAEVFAKGLQDLGRARLFGSPTAGAVLGSIIEKLPNGDGFQFPFADYMSAGGEALEGVGVMPDEAVRLDRDALLAGHDLALERASEWIRNQRKKGN